MTLEQTTLFGVRGERIRIRKSSPIAAVPGLRGDVVTDYSLAAEAEGGRAGGKDEGKRPTLNSQRSTGGETTGCSLAMLAMIFALTTLVLWMRAHSIAAMRVNVEWLAAYPDAVCERCGKVLDGKDDGCDEEGAR